MKKDLSRETIIEVYNALNFIKKSKNPVCLEQKIKFNHAVSRNLNMLEKLCETIIETQNEHLKNFKQEMNSIGETFSIKDKNNKPILSEDGTYNIDKSLLYEYNQKMETCNKNYESVLKESKIYIKDIESVELYMINVNDIPQMDKNFQSILICIDPIILYEE